MLRVSILRPASMRVLEGAGACRTTSTCARLADGARIFGDSLYRRRASATEARTCGWTGCRYACHTAACLLAAYSRCQQQHSRSLANTGCVAARSRARLGLACSGAWGVACDGRVCSCFSAGAMGDDAYFESYGDLATHEVMLKDAPRMAAYAAAVEANAAFIRGKAVLDVGAGTGILSLLCARAGARAVYAVEASPMAEHMRSIVELNGFADVITVFQSPMEETTLPEQVDVCISEWMGFHLLHEARCCCCVALSAYRAP